MARYEDRLKQWDETKIKHIATGIRKKFEDEYDFTDMDDRTVLSRHRARFAETMSPEDYEKKLNEVYATGFAPRPEETLLDKGQTALEHAPQAAAEMAPILGAFAGAEGIVAAAKPAMKGAARLVGQAGFVAGHSLNIAEQNRTAGVLEKTKEDLVQRDPEVLAQEYFDKLLPGLTAKGWTPEDIGDEAIRRANNVMKGYQATVQSLEEDITQTRADQVAEVGKGAADAFFLGVGAPVITGALQKGLSKLGFNAAARVAAKPASNNLVGAVGRHAGTGIIVGVPGMALQGGVTEGLQAAVDGAAPADIGREITKGATEGAKHGLIGGAVLGGLLGTAEGAIGAVARKTQAAKVQREWRASKAQEELDAARLEGWQEHRRIRTERATADAEMAQSRAQELSRKLGVEQARQADLTRAAIARTAADFDPHVAQLPAGADAGDVATTIIQKSHGTDAALSEAGMRAASQIEQKLRLYQDANAEIEAFQSRALPPGGSAEVPPPPGSIVGPAPVEPARVTPQLGKPLGAVESGGVEPPPLSPPSAALTPEGQIIPPNTGPAPLPMPEKTSLPPLAEVQTPTAAVAAAKTPELAPKTMEPVSLPTKAEEAITRVEAHPNISVIPAEEGRALHIEKIGMSQPGGKVGDALNSIVRRADEEQLPITVALTQVAGPKGGHIPIEKQFEKFYAPRGFKIVESTKLPEGMMATARLRRDPQPLPAKRIGMLEAQKLMMERGLGAEIKSPAAAELSAPGITPGPGRWHEINLWADANIVAARERIAAREAAFPEIERAAERQRGSISSKERTRPDPSSYDWADFADRVQIGVNIMVKHGLNKAEWVEHMVRELGGKFRDVADKVYTEAVAAFNARRPTGIDEVRRVVDDYVHQAGLGRGATKHDVYPKVDEKFARRVADAYHDLKNVKEGSPEWLAAKNSYEQLNKEIEAQYQAMIAAGYKVEHTVENPYATSADMRADVAQNKRIASYKSDESHHPFMTAEQTDKLRAVHDFFGHASEGYEFGPRGEDAAFRKHATTLSNKAIPALATETRGQNSWVNFRPENAKLSPKDRPFAEQKFGLLPDWVYEDVIKERAGRAAPNRLGRGFPTKGRATGGAGGVVQTAESLSRGVRPVKNPTTVRARFTQDGSATVNEMMQTHPQSANWYHDEIKYMHERVGERIPEVNEPGGQALFDILLGFTSPQKPVQDNFAIAYRLAEDFFKSGKVPSLQRFGQEVNLTSGVWVPKLNALIKKFDGDLVAMREFLLNKDAKGRYNLESALGENPKVSQFTLNIMGIHDKITTDVWMVRRLRRLTGTLFETTDGKRVFRDRETPSIKEKADIEEAIKEISQQTGLDHDAVQAILWDNEKMVWERAGMDAPRISFKTAVDGVFKNIEENQTAIGESLRKPEQGSLGLE